MAAKGWQEEIKVLLTSKPTKFRNDSLNMIIVNCEVEWVAVYSATFDAPQGQMFLRFDFMV